MTAIWHNDGTAWKLLAPSGFPAEAALHTLVEQEATNPAARRQPSVGHRGPRSAPWYWYRRSLAIEPSGRIAIIEIKLARNAEARRAVISQVLAYAAYLYGSSVENLEGVTLAAHFVSRGYTSLADAVRKNDQEGSFDEDDFRSALSANLADGRFRLVFVLDSAPDELVSIAAFLEAISDKLVIDLIAVSSYDVGGSQIVVPQRITPEARQPTPEPNASDRAASSKGSYARSSSDFRRAIDRTAEARAVLIRLTEWAETLEANGWIILGTYSMGNGLSWSLLPYVPVANAGLVTIYNWRGKPYLQFWRSVFVRRAPNSIAAVETCLAPTLLGQGNQIVASDVTPELLEALTTAYEEAAQPSQRVAAPVSNDPAASTAEV